MAKQLKPVETNSDSTTMEETDSEEESTLKQNPQPESSEFESDEETPAPAKPSPEVIKPDSKKVLFQRIWSEDDEIVILQGMIDYEAENNCSPGTDLDAFLDFIRDDLHRVDVNKANLQDKIRRLKKKFQNNKAKKTRKFAKPHENVCYELSLKIWGDDYNGKVAKVSNEYGEKKVGKRPGSSFDMNVEEKLMRMGAELFEGEDGTMGSKEWKKLDREAMELSLKQLDVKRAKMKLVLDSME